MFCSLTQFYADVGVQARILFINFLLLFNFYFIYMETLTGMTPEVAKIFAKALCILAMMPTAIGEGMIAAKAMEAMGRNPEAADTIFPKMIVGIALTESTAIYALVAFFLI